MRAMTDEELMDAIERAMRAVVARFHPEEAARMAEPGQAMAETDARGRPDPAPVKPDSLRADPDAPDPHPTEGGTPR